MKHTALNFILQGHWHPKKPRSVKGLRAYQTLRGQPWLVQQLVALNEFADPTIAKRWIEKHNVTTLAEAKLLLPNHNKKLPLKERLLTYLRYLLGETKHDEAAMAYRHKPKKTTHRGRTTVHVRTRYYRDD